MHGGAAYLYTWVATINPLWSVSCPINPIHSHYYAMSHSKPRKPKPPSGLSLAHKGTNITSPVTAHEQISQHRGWL